MPKSNSLLTPTQRKQCTATPLWLVANIYSTCRIWKESSRSQTENISGSRCCAPENAAVLHMRGQVCDQLIQYSKPAQNCFLHALARKIILPCLHWKADVHKTSPNLLGWLVIGFKDFLHSHLQLTTSVLAEQSAPPTKAHQKQNCPIPQKRHPSQPQLNTNQQKLLPFLSGTPEQGENKSVPTWNQHQINDLPI